MNDGPPSDDAPIQVAAAAEPSEVTLILDLPPACLGQFWRAACLAPLRAGRTRRSPARLAWHDAPSPAPDAPPIASLEGYRRDLAVRPDHGVSSVSLLEGVLTIGAVTRPVAELTLRGAAVETFALARALLNEVPARVSLTGLPADPRRTAPKPPALRPEWQVDAAFAHVVSQLAATIAHHAPAARTGETIEAVHQMRVALRRLRSALSLFRKLAGGPALDRARQDLTELARALGPARDWDVFLAGAGRDIAALLPAEKALTRMIAAARRRRQAAYADLARALDGPGFQGLLIDLIELATVAPRLAPAAPDRPTLMEFARHALDRRLRQAREAGEDVSSLAPADLHALRIRCKRLRYAAELFVPLAPGRQSRRFLRRLAAVQERLGLLNDGTVAADLLAGLGSRGFAAGATQGYLAARAAGGRAKAERSWKRFHKAEPFWR